MRDDITAAVAGVRMVGNSVLRVMADANAGLAHLTLRYIDWLARQLLPDTAETEWLDRHGDIWLKNSDGTVGRKSATYAGGIIKLTGSAGTIIPAGTRFSNGTTDIEYETTRSIFISNESTTVDVLALDPGADGNMDAGDELELATAIAGLDGTAEVVEMSGGADQEDDDDLRARVLLRIQEPPMGGCQTDFVEWALAIPGVTRAWCYPLEMGIGTVTVRFMCDELRADVDGFPLADDIERVTTYLDSVRPVAVKDRFIVAPVPYPINLQINDLDDDSEATREAIELAVDEMLKSRATPGQTIYRSWIGEAVSGAVGEDHHELIFDTTIMPSTGHLAVLGTIEYE